VWRAGDGTAPEGRWIEEGELETLVFPVSHKKIVTTLRGESVSARRGALSQ